MAHLFKYVTSETGLKIIENRTLRWSTPALLNDPFDMQFAFQFRIDRQIARKMALDKCWQHFYGELVQTPLNDFGKCIRLIRDDFPRMTRSEFELEMGDVIDKRMDKNISMKEKYNSDIRTVFSRDKILCLSDTATSILMWSYYAQNHSGLVLRFRDDTLNNPLSAAKPIQYVDQMPSLFDNEILSDVVAGYRGMSEHDVLDHVVLTKSNHWAHEREWRVYAGCGRSDNSFEDVPFNAKELDGIIFGLRMAANERERFTDIIETRYPHVELLESQAKPDTYELIIRTIGYAKY